MLSFVQAADRGSFAAAARAMGISSAAVGKNVAGLEGALGVRLMNRSTRSLQLTGEGLAFLERARVAIDALDTAIDSVAAQRAQPAGRVRISASHWYGHQYVLPLLPALIERYPALVPDVELDDRRVDLVRDGFDLAFRGGHLEDSGIVSRHVCDLLTVLVAAPDYLRRHGLPQRPDDLARHRLIAVRFLNGTVARWQFKRPKGQIEERKPEPAALVVSDPQAALDAAARGVGIAQTGIHHAFEHLREGRLKIVLAKYHDGGSRRMALQYPHRALIAPRVRATADFLLAGLARTAALHMSVADVLRYAA